MKARAAAWLVVWLALMGALAAGGPSAAAPASAVDTAFWRGVLEQGQARQDAEGGLLRAAAYVNLGRIIDALDEVDALSKLAYRDLAKVLVPRYEKAVEAAPDDRVALNCLVFGYYALDQMDAAIATLQRLIRLDAANPWPRNLLAIAYLTREEYGSARAVAQEALALDPDNEYSHLILAYAYLHQRDYLRFLTHYLRGRGAARELQQYLARQATRSHQPVQTLPARVEGDGAPG